MTLVSNGGFLPSDNLNEIITTNFQKIVLEHANNKGIELSNVEQQSIWDDKFHEEWMLRCSYDSSLEENVENIALDLSDRILTQAYKEFKSLEESEAKTDTLCIKWQSGRMVYILEKYLEDLRPA